MASTRTSTNRQDDNEEDGEARKTNPTSSSSSSSRRVLLTVCPKCKGEGKLIQPASRKTRKRYKLSNNNNNNINNNSDNSQQRPPPPPRIDGCKVCHGSGLVEAQDNNNNGAVTNNTTNTNNFPHVAIIGGGLGGLALGVGCRHRSIPFTVYERDLSFLERSQGYGLTMQQASRILASLGISPIPLQDGIVSTKHIVHTPEGRVVGEWGLRKWLSPEQQEQKQQRGQNTKDNNNNNNNKKNNKRQNVHIARQSLRLELLKALGGSSQVQWGHKLVNFTEHENHVDLIFDVSNSPQQQQSSDSNDSAGTTTTSTTIIRKQAAATLLVGADGIRSTVRKQWLGEDITPLRYLGCIVILGICPLSTTKEEEEEFTSSTCVAMGSHPLLDGETVFQTADGSTRIYMMPYSTKEYMWQLSFPMTEQEAKELSCQGPKALKEESIKKCRGWHDPIIPILQLTPVALVSGYPVYDRDLLTKEIILQSSSLFLSSSSASGRRRVTLVGDAGHPMSPFKGQGANQALLDALSLVRILYKQFQGLASTTTSIEGKEAADNKEAEATVLQRVLETYEEEMMARSSVKVKASAEAAHFLHTEVAIQEGNVTRGTAAKERQQRNEQK